MATVTEAPATSTPATNPTAASESFPAPKWELPRAVATLYNFPSMEPVRFTTYKATELLLPLRRDLLHRAVIYEGDMTRQGTANAKWRNDVRGSSKKIRPQKGTGRARLGDKKSPMLRGGGAAHGPHPRDFSTGLPLKVYDKALRTALSYRYRRGELFIINGNIELPEVSTPPRMLQNIVQKHKWGRAFGRSLLITEEKEQKLANAAAQLPKEVRVLNREDVDVKDLLENGRLIIEDTALRRILQHHSRDL